MVIILIILFEVLKQPPIFCMGALFINLNIYIIKGRYYEG